MLADLTPQIVQVREGNTLLGLVILRRDKGYAKLPVPFWRSALHHEQYLGTPLVREGREEAFAKGFCQWLDQAPADCGFVNLSMISADGKPAQALVDHCRKTSRRIFETRRHERAAIRPPQHRGTPAKDLLRSSRRKGIRKAMSKLAKRGEVKIERLDREEYSEAWIAHFLDLEDTGWKHEGGSSIRSCAKETELYERIICEAFRAGTLNFTRLCLDNRPIAYTLDIATAPIGFCLKSAIDQSYRQYSPGILLEIETLEYYLANDQFALLDSCSSPDNAILNELWPDRRTVCDLAIERKSLVHRAGYRLAFAIKSLAGTAREV